MMKYDRTVHDFVDDAMLAAVLDRILRLGRPVSVDMLAVEFERGLRALFLPGTLRAELRDKPPSALDRLPENEQIALAKLWSEITFAIVDQALGDGAVCRDCDRIDRL